MTDNSRLFTQAGFVQAAEDYNFHVAAAELKLEIYLSAIERGVNPQQIEVIGVLNQIKEHEQQIDIHEATLRQYIAKFPALRSHWAVSEYELNFLDA